MQESVAADEQVENADELHDAETADVAVAEVPGSVQELAWGQHEIPFQQEQLQAAGNDPLLYEVSDAEFELLLGAGVLSNMGFPGHPDEALSFSFGPPQGVSPVPVGATASFGEQQHFLQMEQFQQQQQQQLFQQQMYEQYQQSSMQQVPDYSDTATCPLPAKAPPVKIVEDKVPKAAPKRTGAEQGHEEGQDGAGKDSEGEGKATKSTQKKPESATQVIVPKKAARRKQAGHPPPGPKKGPGCKLIFLPLEPLHAAPLRSAVKHTQNEAPSVPTNNNPEDHEADDARTEEGSQAWDSNGFDTWTNAEGEELSHEPQDLDEASPEGSSQDDGRAVAGSALHSARALRKQKTSEPSPRSSSTPPPVSQTQRHQPRPPAGNVPKGRLASVSASNLATTPTGRKSNEVTKGVGGGLIFGGADTLPGLHMPVPPPKVPGSRRPSPRHKALHKSK